MPSPERLPSTPEGWAEWDILNRGLDRIIEQALEFLAEQERKYRAGYAAQREWLLGMRPLGPRIVYPESGVPRTPEVRA